MPDLVELDLRKNQISVVPIQLSACTSLAKLHLGDNKVGLGVHRMGLVRGIGGALTEVRSRGAKL